MGGKCLLLYQETLLVREEFAGAWQIMGCAQGSSPLMAYYCMVGEHHRTLTKTMDRPDKIHEFLKST